MVSFTDHYNAITIDRLSSKTIIEKFHGTLLSLFYVSSSSPQLHRLYFSDWKKQKTTSPQQVTGEDKPTLVLKKNLRYFIKLHHSKKYYNFTAEFFF